MSQSRFILRNVSDGSETEIAGRLIVGRQHDCGLVLPGGGPDGGVSRKHAEFSLSDGAVWVEDLKSLNGTYVNQTRLTEKTRLRPGDRVRFDVIEFELKDLSAVEEATVFRDAKTRLRQVEPEPAPAAPPPVKAAPPPAPPPQLPPSPQARTVETPVAAAVQSPKPPPSTSTANAEAKPAEQSQQGPRWIDPDALKEGKTEFYRVDSNAQALHKPNGATPFVVDCPTLVVISGARAGTRVKLQGVAADGAEKKQWTIGSDADRDVLFAEVGVSGRHARIVNEGARWKIINELAKNGTFVDGKRSNVSYLSSGNELRFGSVSCVFELPKRGPAAVGQAMKTAGRKLPVWLIALIASFVVTGAIVVAWGYLR